MKLVSQSIAGNLIEIHIPRYVAWCLDFNPAYYDGDGGVVLVLMIIMMVMVMMMMMML